jgi:chemotaxis protein MotB
MSRRRQKQQGHVNHERWLVSYADFITLLFAFFVVMYAISSVNEGKYRVLSDTLEQVFVERDDSPDESVQVTQSENGDLAMVGEQPGTSMIEAIVAEQGMDEPGAEAVDVEGDGFSDGQDLERRMGFVAATLESVLQPFIEQGSAEIVQKGTTIEIDMKSRLLFESGSARLSRDAINALRDVGKVISRRNYQIRVEGYTDNIPINTIAYPSNWELSASRAASVVHLFEKLGVPSGQLSAVGYGEHRPLASNATAEGRERNRRVSIVLSGESYHQPESPAPGDG